MLKDFEIFVFKDLRRFILILNVSLFFVTDLTAFENALDSGTSELLNLFLIPSLFNQISSFSSILSNKVLTSLTEYGIISLPYWPVPVDDNESFSWGDRGPFDAGIAPRIVDLLTNEPRGAPIYIVCFHKKLNLRLESASFLNVSLILLTRSLLRKTLSSYMYKSSSMLTSDRSSWLWFSNIGKPPFLLLPLILFRSCGSLRQLKVMSADLLVHDGASLLVPLCKLS